MPRLEKISDFFMTGCAVAPALALLAGQPEIALLSHVVLLFTGIGFAACEDDAPFRSAGIVRQASAYPARTPSEDRIG